MLNLQVILPLTILWDLLIANHFVGAHTELLLNFVLKDKKLKSNVYLRRFNSIRSAHLCGIQCLSYREKCRSINYNPSTKHCELLPQNVGFYDEEQFENAVNWVYYGNRLVSYYTCLLYTSPSPRDKRQSRMPSSA